MHMVFDHLMTTKRRARWHLPSVGHFAKMRSGCNIYSDIYWGNWGRLQWNTHTGGVFECNTLLCGGGCGEGRWLDDSGVTGMRGGEHSKHSMWRWTTLTKLLNVSPKEDASSNSLFLTLPTFPELHTRRKNASEPIIDRRSKECLDCNEEVKVGLNLQWIAKNYAIVSVRLHTAIKAKTPIEVGSYISRYCGTAPPQCCWWNMHIAMPKLKPKWHGVQISYPEFVEALWAHKPNPFFYLFKESTWVMI